MKIEVYAKVSRLNNPLKIGKHPFDDYFKLPIEDCCVSYDESELENIKKAFDSHFLFFNELPLMFGCFLTKKLSFNDFMKGMIEKTPKMDSIPTTNILTKTTRYLSRILTKYLIKMFESSYYLRIRKLII
jgi:hypothetical protein